MSGVFDTEGTLQVALSTLAKNSAGGLGRGTRARKLHGKARPIGGGIWVDDGPADCNVYVYGTRGKRIRYAGVSAAGAIASSDKTLRSYVKRAGLR